MGKEVSPMEKYEKGKIIKGTVSGIEPYGIFVNIDEYYTGLIHISEVSTGFVRDPAHFANVGETINVQILDIDEKECQMKLSIKNISYRDRAKRRRRQIIETKSGFKTLAYKLPFWIDENLKKVQLKSKRT